MPKWRCQKRQILLANLFGTSVLALLNESCPFTFDHHMTSKKQLHWLIHCCDTCCKTGVPWTRDNCNAMWKHSVATDRGGNTPSKGAELDCFVHKYDDVNRPKNAMFLPASVCAKIRIWAPAFYHIEMKIDNWQGHVISHILTHGLIWIAAKIISLYQHEKRRASRETKKTAILVSFSEVVQNNYH